MIKKMLVQLQDRRVYYDSLDAIVNSHDPYTLESKYISDLFSLPELPWGHALHPSEETGK